MVPPASPSTLASKASSKTSPIQRGKRLRPYEPEKEREGEKEGDSNERSQRLQRRREEKEEEEEEEHEGDGEEATRKAEASAAKRRIGSTEELESKPGKGDLYYS